MKPVEWKTYRTRFLVKAKQLSSALSFTDHLGRKHCGRKGDYLVESSDGVLSIAPRQIFEDIYVAMHCSSEAHVSEENPAHEDLASIPEEMLNFKNFQPLEIERIEKPKFRPCAAIARSMESETSARSRRKSPQPLRSPRVPSHLSLM